MSKKLALVLIAVLMFSVAAAADVSVFVGYADNLRNSGFFPNPWNGSSSVEFFMGDPTATFDSGAVRIDNTGSSSVVISSFTVTTQPNGGIFADSAFATTFNIWGGSLPITLDPGMSVIFTQNSTAENFDSSDQPFVDVGTHDYSSGDFGGCNTPDDASIQALCDANKPLVQFTVDGNPFSLNDSGHVLDTFGYDLAGQFCPEDNGGCNESIGWHKIGDAVTTRNNVPEPASLALLGTGLLGLARRKRNKK